jgi:hypothetical protein
VAIPSSLTHTDAGLTFDGMKAALGGLAVAVLVCAAAPPVRAADSSLGVSLGYVEARNVDPTLVFSGDFRFHLSGKFALAPEFSYWKKSQSSLSVTSSVEDLQFGVNLVAVLPASRRVEFFLGGGGGLHHVTGNVQVASAAAVSDSITQGGLCVLGGIDIGAGENLSFFGVARYDWVLGLEGDEPTRLDQYKIAGGFRVRF